MTAFLSQIQYAFLMTTSAPAQLGEEASSASVIDVLETYESILRYPVFGHFPIGVLTPSTVTMLGLDSQERGEE